MPISFKSVLVLTSYVVFLSAPCAFAQSTKGALASYNKAQSESLALVNQATDLLQAKKGSEALPLLKKADSLTPGSAVIHLNIGCALSQMSKFDDAYEQYQLALQLQPGFPPAVMNSGYYFWRKGDLLRAEGYFMQFLKENPQAPERTKVEADLLQVESAKAGLENKTYDEKKLLEQAIQREPRSTGLHFQLAAALERLGDAEGAVREYKTVLATDPDDAAALFNLAGAYQNLGDTANAIACFQEYTKKHPDSKDLSSVQYMIRALSQKRLESVTDEHGPDYVDSLKDEKGRVYRWHSQSMPLKIYVASADGLPEFKPGYYKLLFDSFEAWKAASKGQVSFQQVENDSAADIIVDWTNDPFQVKGDGDAEQGVCKMNVGGGSKDCAFVRHATVRLLIIQRDTQKPLSDEDMQKTCLHEVGHALGLHGHSKNNHDVMFFSISPTVWPVLSKRDKATLFRIYAEYPANGEPVSQH